MKPDPIIVKVRVIDELTFDQVTATNRERCERWHPGFDYPPMLTEDSDPVVLFGQWNGADWSNAMQGEAGEAGNVVKKLRRKDGGLRGAVDPERDELLRMLGDELADTFLYLDLLATYYAIDLPAAIVRKFNAISEREGFPERLP